MRQDEIDKILEQAAAGLPNEVDAALLRRVARSIAPSMRPVRPLPPVWILAAGLFLVCVGVALVAAAGFGFAGVRKLDSTERFVIFPVLLILVWLSAWTSAGEMIPGRLRRVAPQSLLMAVSLVLVCVFSGLFRDYTTESFVKQGFVCLSAGLLVAVPTVLMSWLVLRRGFAVNPIAAGLAVATLGGLAGVTMLELHCANLEAPHLIVWHTAVILVSGSAGALLARIRLERS